MLFRSYRRYFASLRDTPLLGGACILRLNIESRFCGKNGIFFFLMRSKNALLHHREISLTQYTSRHEHSVLFIEFLPFLVLYCHYLYTGLFASLLSLLFTDNPMSYNTWHLSSAPLKDLRTFLGRDHSVLSPSLGHYISHTCSYYHLVQGEVHRSEDMSYKMEQYISQPLCTSSL